MLLVNYLVVKNKTFLVNLNFVLFEIKVIYRSQKKTVIDPLLPKATDYSIFLLIWLFVTYLKRLV